MSMRENILGALKKHAYGNIELNKMNIYIGIENELRIARDKFHNFHSYHEGYAVIKEELEELWDEIKTTENKEKMHKELIQIIAMCIRFIEDLIYKDGDNNGKRKN